MNQAPSLLPLYCPPEYTSPASLAEVMAPYSASRALHGLITIGDERFHQAEDTANQCLHRIEVLGSHFYSDEQLEAERQEYEEIVPVMFRYSWCSTAWWGLGFDMWLSHADDLEALLQEAQGEDDRYRGLTVGDLLAALVEDAE